MNYFSALLVLATKLFSRLFYRLDVNWITPKEEMDWEGTRLVVVLNHTSLFEPLMVAALPNRNLWRAAQRLVVPVADITMQRPFVGRLFRLLAPKAVPITRKRDESWTRFMDQTAGNSLILIFPEGRMKRKDGLDKHGQPMSVKGGVADILQKIDSGKMAIVYSGGLHHVQAPGDWFPKPFRTIQMGVEQVDIPSYKEKMDGKNFRSNVIHDLERRMRLNTPAFT